VQNPFENRLVFAPRTLQRAERRGPDFKRGRAPEDLHSRPVDKMQLTLSKAVVAPKVARGEKPGNPKTKKMEGGPSPNLARFRYVEDP
jgi:hypothetical protein